MIRVNASLPDDLYHAAKTAQLNVSQILQEAIRRALATKHNQTLFDSIRYPKTEISHDDVMSVMDKVRDE